jgi:hypothetical protein
MPNSHMAALFRSPRTLLGKAGSTRCCLSHTTVPSDPTTCPSPPRHGTRFRNCGSTMRLSTATLAHACAPLGTVLRARQRKAMETSYCHKGQKPSETGSVVLHGIHKGSQNRCLKLAVLAGLVAKPTPGSVRIELGVVFPFAKMGSEKHPGGRSETFIYSFVQKRRCPQVPRAQVCITSCVQQV